MNFQPLMDISASNEEMKPIKAVIDEFGDLDIDFHKICTWRAGGHYTWTCTSSPTLRPAEYAVPSVLKKKV